MRTSAPRCGSRSGASARTGLAAWNGCAAQARSPDSGRTRRESAVRVVRIVREDWDDERLLAALREALRARQDVPAWFIETGQGAYAWHDIDAQLARLT